MKTKNKKNNQFVPLGYFRRLPVSVLLTLGCVGFLQAQGLVTSGPSEAYNPKAPPTLALPEAYSLAQARLSDATNRFYCVSATCLEKTCPGYAGWAFVFCNTNGERGRVEVYFANKKAYIPDAQSQAVLK